MHFRSASATFSNIQQSRLWTACRWLEKLVLPAIFDIFDTRHHHHRRVVRVTVARLAPLRDPW